MLPGLDLVHTFMGSRFTILAIDGGGIRGIFAAQILKRMQEELQIDPAEFDLITGTSTGSIIAGALAAGLSIQEIVSFYENEGPKVFRSQAFSFFGYLRSNYESSYLESALKHTIPDIVLGSVSKRLIIPATDILNGNVHVFKSGYLPEFVRDRNVKLVDAILASCSAPGYFNPHQVNPYLISDGGLWANNPSLVAVIEAIGKLQIDIPAIRLLSIGTGASKAFYSFSKPKPWGLLTTWGLRKLVDMIFNLQSDASTNMAGLLVPTNSLRLNFQSDHRLPLDDTRCIPTLLGKADYTFTHNSEKIRTLLK